MTVARLPLRYTLRNLFRRPLHVPRATHQEEDFLPPGEDSPT